MEVLGHDSVDVTVEISDASFKGASGISIQDAAPMAYEKLVQLLATEDAIESKKLCLTEPDIAQYKARHLSSQKRACLMSERRRRSDRAIGVDPNHAFQPSLSVRRGPLFVGRSEELRRTHTREPASAYSAYSPSDLGKE